MAIEYCIGRSTEDDVLAHLSRCEHDFVPPLGNRVNVSNYASKIVGSAERLEAWANGELVGLVAVYCNSPDGNAAFVTSVSVLPVWQGTGIASRLLAHCVTRVRELGFTRIELEVSGTNTAAIALYLKLGFTNMGQPDVMQKMKMNLIKEER